MVQRVSVAQKMRRKTAAKETEAGHNVWRRAPSGALARLDMRVDTARSTWTSAHQSPARTAAAAASPPSPVSPARAPQAGPGCAANPMWTSAFRGPACTAGGARTSIGAAAAAGPGPLMGPLLTGRSPLVLTGQHLAAPVPAILLRSTPAIVWRAGAAATAKWMRTSVHHFRVQTGRSALIRLVLTLSNRAVQRVSVAQKMRRKTAEAEKEAAAVAAGRRWTQGPSGACARLGTRVDTARSTWTSA